MEIEKNIIVKSSMVQMKDPDQINHVSHQQSTSKSGSLKPSTSYVSSAKEKENHQEIIESHLHKNQKRSQTTITQSEIKQVTNFQENYTQFAAGVKNEKKPVPSSGVESETTRSTTTVQDHFVVNNKERTEKPKAKTSTPRESMRITQVETNYIPYKHSHENKTNTDNDYLQMLREKEEYLRTGQEENTRSQGVENRTTTGQTKTSKTDKDVHVQRKTKTDKIENENTNTTERTKKYIITQQEIVFYLKNADGVLRIIHRPLMSKKQEYTEKCDNGKLDKSLRVRRMSQPDLHTNQSVRHEEGSNYIEIKPEESKRVKLLKNEEKHITNVGVIHQSNLSHGHGSSCFNPIGGNWRSSGSIFDCEQGCFSDTTVII